MAGTENIVYSSTLDAVAEPRTGLERVFDPEAVAAMLTKAERDVSIGGATVAAEAIRAGLVDRYVLRSAPTIVGVGTRALPATPRIDLTLDSTRRFDDGSVLVDYSLR